MGPETSYEFDVAEPAFLAWASLNAWQMTKLNGREAQVYRFSGAPTRQATSSDGYYYEWVNPAARDDTLVILYDRPSGRAYYHRSYR